MMNDIKLTCHVLSPTDTIAILSVKPTYGKINALTPKQI